MPPSAAKLSGLLERRLDAQAATQARLDALLHTLRRDPSDASALVAAREAVEALAVVTAGAVRLQYAARLAAVIARGPSEIFLGNLSEGHL